MTLKSSSGPVDSSLICTGRYHTPPRKAPLQLCHDSKQVHHFLMAQIFHCPGWVNDPGTGALNIDLVLKAQTAGTGSQWQNTDLLMGIG